MVDYSILNTKSLPFLSKEDFYRELQNFSMILNYLRDKGYYTSIRSIVDIKSLDIVKGINLQKLLGEIRDRDMKRRVTSLFTNQIIPFEYPISTTGEELGLLEYRYLDERVDEIGYADIFQTLLISFNSSEKWDKDRLNLKKIILEESGDYTEREVEIYNTSRVEHLESNLEIFEKIDNEKIESLVKNFKETYRVIFKKLEFGIDVIKNIEYLDKRVLRDAIAILYQLEIGKKELTDFKCSGESESVLNNPELKERRKFKMENGEEYYMFQHIKNLPNGNRIYFHKKSDEKIYIGYIGKHLKTVKY
ncbi:hypothetical protein [uncultured Fusobacterium sp.]|uniref:hypothetical protein n=1 Tax=uncultured Fusobacterium sp. TaxID=159267 RepID=UPI0025E778E8|nr:hypothetical protein [uncultured Fusobacterium sp.]